MTSAGYKAFPPFIFLSTQQLLLLLSLLLCLALMLPFINGTTSTTTSTNNTMRSCIKAERDALLAFKAEIIYHKVHPISSWGDQTDDCCHWAGVHCDSNSGHIVHLNLQRSRPRQYYDDDVWNIRCDEWDLSGKISQSLIALQHLTYLDLSGNCFINISIPKLLGSLENLIYLDISHSGFTGVIPHELGNLTRLRYLNLATDDGPGYNVDDVEWLSSLSSLRYLFMDGASFFGVNNTMQTLNKLPHLKQVSLFDCSMNSIPESLPYLNFTSLVVMDIGFNMFDNTSIPEWLFRISKLQNLSMVACGFTGAIPSSIGKAKSLQFLDLSGNKGISGDMPRGFGDLCNLQSLRLGHTFLGKSLEDFKDAFSGCIRRSLNVLSFAYSSLQGPLPSWLGEFRNLTFLDLALNSFNSSIPASIGRLSQLQELHFYGSALNGSIPESMGRLSRLQYLDLSQNALNGSIPESLGRLSRLQTVDLRSNKLNGPLPESLSQLSNLVTLDLSYNNFNYCYSIITEAHLANLTSLKFLVLDHTNLVLNISTDWIPGFQADHIYLSDCHVGPKFPLWLANQVNLSSLDISNARIKDSIPDWFWNITYTIRFLNLSNNEIYGRLPQRLKFQSKEDRLGIFLGSNCFEGLVPYFPPNVYALDLSNNSFSGAIPYDLGNFGGIRPWLTFLSFSSNNLVGSIPNSLCNFVDLVSLELSNNRLEGVIPDCWNNLMDLQYLILANNLLVSEVPDSFVSSSQSLQVLHLSNNQLHGQFPSFLKECTSITTLALDHNNLSGKIPSWVGETMTSLMIFTLKENKFSGNLPLLSNLTLLHFLDFSHNSFVGNIPHSYGNLKGMINISMDGGATFSANISGELVIKITVSTKGLELQFGVTLSSFKFIDLSENNLSGQIPKNIVNLVGLQNLDLSRNHLSGNIPSNIGLMQSLESLDLSRNELTGSIPLSLSTLNFLGSLNLSHNNLSGKIPYADHLTTFNDPSIYVNNLNLCGTPLGKLCISTEPPSNRHDQEDDDDNDSPPIWFCIGLMPGFVVGFWTVWGILLFKKEWSHIYFRFLDHTYDMIYEKISHCTQ
ncbi:receptor-like protein EIX2 [Dioscorea cayenensis subsp. rotundata]|uniref:Receptor-like protein EIX2 n=1 Tax=Dioscorea cayennensis subsp. rotundata TaxID=55577 RepID=A0AB40CC09_DIOCR|nr:receptor-like protein EIX2 [Dioscorea cayenensis subsp. rotundata]